MATTSAPAIRRVAPANSFLRIVVAGCFLFWLALGISPANRVGWALEHTPVFIVVLILAKTYRAFTFSNLSYTLIAIFVALHSIGAHYGYAYVPFGFWLRDVFDLGRNHYDRIVHFASGLLIAYPIREIIVRATGLRGSWAGYLTLNVVGATSGFYEVAEMIVAVVINPELGVLYLGTQGDVWDAQMDMGMATLGAMIALFAIACHRKPGSRTRVAYR